MGGEWSFLARIWHTLFVSDDVIDDVVTMWRHPYMYIRVQCAMCYIPATNKRDRESMQSFDAGFLYWLFKQTTSRPDIPFSISNFIPLFTRNIISGPQPGIECIQIFINRLYNIEYVKTRLPHRLNRTKRKESPDMHARAYECMPRNFRISRRKLNWTEFRISELA